MICTNKLKQLGICGLVALVLTACGSPAVEYDSHYDTYTNTLGSSASGNSISFFAKDLCVGPDKDLGTDTTTSQVAEAAGVFNLSTKEITYSKNIYKKLYPASTTKILTAYIILKTSNLDDQVTVSDLAAKQSKDSSTAKLKAGDITTVRNLLYGLMLPSGNDAAIALAEYHSGSVEAFCEVMNQTAHDLGCTGSNFTNANGLPDENHYTTVYDMYLIFQAAILNEEFVAILSAPSYEANYLDIKGAAVKNTYHNTNRYLTGQEKSPEGVTVVGGKTGTTNAAGYCLVLLSKNQKDEPIVSIVFKSDTRSDLYLLMNQMLSGFSN